MTGATPYIEVTREEVAAARERADPVAWALRVVRESKRGRYSRKGLVRQVWLTGNHLDRTLVGWAVKLLLEEKVLAVETMERRGLRNRVVRGERWDDEAARARARVRVDAMKRGTLPSTPSFPGKAKKPGTVRAFRA